MTNDLKASLERILGEYPSARAEPLRQHPLARFIRTEFPTLFNQALTRRLPNHRYLVRGTKFLGSWAYIPWISILDPNVTETNQQGIYVVLLFNEDGTSAILAVGQGVTDSTPRVLEENRKRVLAARAPPRGFESGPPPAGTLGSSTPAAIYETAIICYRKYERAAVPDDESILDDTALALNFVDETAKSETFASLSFQKRDQVRDDGTARIRGLIVRREDVLEAFRNTSPSDWEGQPGHDPYYMLQIGDEQKPLKAVMRNALGSEIEAPFTTHEASRAVELLGFEVVDKRERQKAALVMAAKRKWSFSPGQDAELWDRSVANGEITIGWGELGDLSKYKSIEEMLDAHKKAYGSEREPTNNARCTWEFANVMQSGDLIYAKRGRSRLIGIGEVTGVYRWDGERKQHKSVRSVAWHKVGDWALPERDMFGMKTLTDISTASDFIERLDELADWSTKQLESSDEEIVPARLALAPQYTLELLAADSGFPIGWLTQVRDRLVRKRHLVLQGPPGTGKTFLAKGLARAEVSGSAGIIEALQFHPSYSYEDFVQGIRPKARAGSVTFELTPGHFLRFCDRARAVEPAPAVLIIDEFNRANLSRVFGELMYLLEYREESVQLAAGGAAFAIPQNILIIATMNTADRSIALIDHALRRRFSFVQVAPDYSVLRKRLEHDGLPAESLIKTLESVNREIADENLEVGISFFMKDGPALKQRLRQIWEGELEPYLEEVFYDKKPTMEGLRFRVLIKSSLSEWNE
jgi:MoxR-like ATPase